MALIDGGRPLRDVLPPINHPDFLKPAPEKNHHSRFSMMPGLNISTAPLGSPTTLYSGPPPPYSRAPSTTEPGEGHPGHFSPTQPSRRQSIKDEKDPLSNSRTLPSLPSLHEALGGDKVVSFPGPPSATPSHGPLSTPVMAAGQSFPDAPRGPPNPFSHAGVPSQTTAPVASQNESVSAKSNVGPNAGSDTGAYASQPYASSPRTTFNAHRSSGGSFSSVNRPPDSSAVTSPYSNEQNKRGTPFPEYVHPPSSQPHGSNSFGFEPSVKFDETRNPFARSNPVAPYGETVKRHLESFDAEMALNEISEASSRTYEYSRFWTQRHHQSNRSSNFAETGPSVMEIDDMMRQQHRILDSLTRMREVVVMQQALSEQRARVARGQVEDDCHGLHDEYRAGGFAGGDAKKRRGKAAPPGRCHSCNRAETPEWRRGPDGARTLCNACGLHYAKLTRKLGTVKAGAIAGSNLRPKNLDPRSAHN